MFNHGINVYKSDASFASAQECKYSIPFFVGSWPCHTGGGFTGKPQLVKSFAEAKTLGGYSDEWRESTGSPKWSLCQAAYSHFKIYGMAPAVFYNVFDPSTHKTAVTAASFTVTNHMAVLPVDAIIDSGLTVAAGGTDLVLDTD